MGYVCFAEISFGISFVWICMVDIECAAWQSNLGRAVAFRMRLDGSSKGSVC